MRLILFSLLVLSLPAVSCKKGSTASPDKAVQTLIDEVKNQATDDSKAAAESCRIAVDCQQAPPVLETATGFKNAQNKIKVAMKGPVHRGRDSMIVEGQDATLIAKFAYNLAADADIINEDVDIFMSQGCEAGWKKIGTVATSGNDANRTVDSVVDTGGYVMVSLASLGVSKLPVGRHRFIFVLKGNNDTTELYVEVLPKKNAVVVTDIDGTLTAFEEAAAVEIAGVHPESHVGAADMIRSFYHRGYNIFYLTARPAFLMEATREWLNMRGFPPGTVHTTTFKLGATGDAAAAFKTVELAQLKKNTTIVPAYAFGNKPSDVKAFADAGINTDNSYFYKMKGDTTGAKVQDDYRTLVPMAQAAPSFCP